MRVLHLFKVYLPDSFTGVERVIWHIAESTAAHEVHAEVLTLSATPAAGPIAVAGHFVHQAKLDLYLASTGLSLSLFSRFRELAAKADIIHYHFPWPMMDLLALQSGINRPSIVTYHSDIVRQRGLMLVYLPLMHRFLSRTDCIVATSPDYAQSSPVLRHYRKKLQVIPIGIDDAPPADPDRVVALRDRLGERFFLFVGALRYYKGLPFLLEAAKLTGLPVVIAGAGDAGELMRDKPPNVIVTGEVDDADKLALLSLCTAFVFPSHLRSEAFGVALLEAARAGKPMISCSMGTGTTYVNLDGVTGLVVKPADAQGIAVAMRELWDQPDLCASMGRAARKRYEQVFTADRMGKAYADLYQSVLRKSP